MEGAAGEMREREIPVLLLSSANPSSTPNTAHSWAGAGILLGMPVRGCATCGRAVPGRSHPEHILMLQDVPMLAQHVTGKQVIPWACTGREHCALA